MNYKQTAKEARLKVLDLIFAAKTSHIGSNFSCIDILSVLFDKVRKDVDEVILSAGWKAAAWYYFLWKRGVVSKSELDSFCQKNSRFIGLIEPRNRWGLRFAGGSMGYGLPAAVGFALAKKINKEEGAVYVLMSDGELQIGTFWESMLIAGHHQLGNLVILIDYNGYQAMGKVDDILHIGGIPFGGVHHYMNIDGHNYEEISKALNWATGNSEGFISDHPRIIRCETIKGKGVSWMENDNLWHYAQIKDDDYKKALNELNAGV